MSAESDRDDAELALSRRATQTAEELLVAARVASRRAYIFFSVLWITVIIMMGIGLYTLYSYAQHTNRTLACVLSVAPDDRAPDLYDICDQQVP